MADFATYQRVFTEAKPIRSAEGAIEVVRHGDGGSPVLNGERYEGFVDQVCRLGQNTRDRVVISAEKARSLEVVGEIVPRDRLPVRAHESAARIAGLPPLTTSRTRVAPMQRRHCIADEGVAYGVALEGISAADVVRSQSGEAGYCGPLSIISTGGLP